MCGGVGRPPPRRKLLILGSIGGARDTYRIAMNRPLSVRRLPLFVLLLGPVSLAVQGCSGGETEQGTSGSGGSATGGATSTGGATTTGGTTGTGGTTATGGSGATGTGGTKATGGTTGTGGTPATGGTTGTGGTPATGGTTGSCGSTALNEQPFGCAFAWGTNSSGGSLASYSYLQFMSNWVGSEIQQSGSITSCNGCSWLTKQRRLDQPDPGLLRLFHRLPRTRQRVPRPEHHRRRQPARPAARTPSGSTVRRSSPPTPTTPSRRTRPGRPSRSSGCWKATSSSTPTARRSTTRTPPGATPAPPAPRATRSPTRSSASSPPTSPARSSRTCRTPWWPSTTRPGTPTTSPTATGAP